MTKGAAVPPERMAKRGYHGTDYDFEGEVLPSGAHGKSHYPGLSGPSDTYFIPATHPDNERGAWRWSSGGYSDSSEGRSRHRVHITEPVGEQHIDRNLYGGAEPYSDDEWDTHARVAPKQKIMGTAWAPPPDPTNLPEYGGQTHVTQTLGHVNWNQFGGPNYTVHFGSGHAVNDVPSADTWTLRSYSIESKQGQVTQPKPPPKAPGRKRGRRQVKGQEPLL